ncbi:MAG: hypothetical protein RR598_01620 [Anaerorhabdus sp.]|uniref:hypothetical protein n=1 Tax=Anaerorhabdus sp. TaxID=1872524 RepID=UPI002B2027C3|nr:hypothetical protein [Anaerorhabdus sp.]MEA4875400.1 hypothetical protein [Anaerorhabdus sp.]
MATILRHQRLAFLDINGKYELFGNGVTDWTVAGNAKTAEKQYVHQQNAAGGLNGYAPTMAITAEAFSDDPVMEYILDIARTWDIGAKAHTNIVVVDTWEGTDTARVAVMQPVVISIDNPGSGPSGEALAVTATLTYSGDATIGTFNMSTKTFTAGGEAEA